MLESLLSSAADLETLGLVVGVGAVGMAGFSVLRFAPSFQGAVDSFGGFENNQSNGNTQQPLTKIFYQFNHSSSEQWLEWIRNQDLEIQNIAFTKLTDYLKEPLEEIGAVTEEAVKAIISFKRPESYTALLELLRSSVRRWGQFKSINLFFETAAKGLIQLNEEDGFRDLKELIETIIQQDTGAADVLLISMVKAIGSIKNPKAEIVDYYTKLVLNRDCSYNFRKEVLEEIKNLENELDRYNVHLDILTGFYNATVIKFNDNDDNVLTELFKHFQKYIEENKPEIWELLIQCLTKDTTAEILIKAATEYIRYQNNILSREQIASLLTIEDKAIVSLIRESLALRFSLTEEESKLIIDKFSGEDLEFEIKALSSEKIKKTKSIAPELLDNYRLLEAILTAHSAELTKNEKRSSQGIKTILGNAEDEKLYLFRILAANLNHSFIYIDLGSVINSNYDLNEIKNKINNTKPCIIYLAALEDFLLREFNADQKIYQKKILDIMYEVSRSPSIKVIASLGEDKDTINSDAKLQTILTSGARGKFDLSINVNRPNEESRNNLVQECLKQLSSIRMNDEFKLEELIANLEDCSCIEILKFLSDYLSASLLIQGKLLSINDYVQYKETGKLSKLEDTEAETA